MLNKLRKQPSVLAALIVIGLFTFLRIYRLNMPGEQVFDEVYFPKMAYQYLTGEAFFDIHPPLGKLIIALGELIFGNTTVGWRIMPLLAGIAMVPVGYWSSYQLFRSRRVSLLTAFLLAIDGLFIVYSRVGLMDGFMILFGLAAIGFTWRFRRERLAGQLGWSTLFLAGLFAGLAVAIKWIGIGFLPLVGLMALFTLWQTKFKSADLLVWLTSIVIVPVVVYTLPFMANWQADFWPQFIEWHHQAWNYNVNLNATHPYASKWWSWPFLIRPIWFYYKGVDPAIVGINGLGNPIVWWGSTLAVIYSLLLLGYVAVRRRRDEALLADKNHLLPIIFLIAGWAIFYLPWTVVGRVLFLYHYFASYLFALLLTAYWLGELFRSTRSRYVAYGLLGVAVAIGLLFAPIWIGYPISGEWMERLKWFKSWI